MSDGLALRGQRGAQAVGLARTVPQRPALAAFLESLRRVGARTNWALPLAPARDSPTFLPHSLRSLVQAGRSSPCLCYPALRQRCRSARALNRQLTRRNSGGKQ